MAKKFKLVYEDNGVIKGSYSGIPGKEDVSLIEREVLEGTKPVQPAPEPTPEPEYDNEKVMQELHDCLEFIMREEGNVDRVFEFKNCTYRLLKEMWESLDGNEVQEFIINILGINLFMEQDFNFSLNLNTSNEAELTSEHSFDFVDDTTTTYFCASIETDAETGDSRVTVGCNPDTVFSGTITVRYTMPEAEE